MEVLVQGRTASKPRRRSPTAWSTSAAWTATSTCSTWTTARRSGSITPSWASAPRPRCATAWCSSATPTASSIASRPPRASCGAPRPTPKSTPAPNFYKDKVLFGSQDATLYCLEASHRQAGLEVHDRRTDSLLAHGRRRSRVSGRLRRQAAHHRSGEGRGDRARSKSTLRPARTPARRRTRVLFRHRGLELFRHRLERGQGRCGTMKSPRNMPFRSSAAVTEQAVIFGGRDKQVYALDPTTGTSCGNLPRVARSTRSPVIVGERVYVGSSDGRLYALDRARRARKFGSIEAGGDFTASPAVAAGRLVIGNTDGTLYCFGAKARRETRRLQQSSAARGRNDRWQLKRPRPKSAATSSSNYPPFSQWTAEALGRRARRSIAAAGPPGQTGAAGPVSAHSVLPQALQVLLLPRLHRQERRRRRDATSRRCRARSNWSAAAGHGRPAVPLRLFRRRHALVPERQAAHLAGRSAAGQHQLGPGRGSHVRVRARHAVAAQGGNARASWASRG